MRAPGMMISMSIIALIAAVSASRSPDYTWRQGRATHYGGPGDAWSIHEGSCEYYYLDPNVATGWDVVAPSDQNWDFEGATHGGGSCGVCYEVACASAVFKDGYGNQLDRSGKCYDESASVIVMVTDTCPCVYPTNAYSNKRWCCGDMYHLDMSTYAFEKLADKRWGVIGIKYRRVSCDYAPAKRAVLPNGAKASAAEGGRQPWGWDSSKDKRIQAGVVSSASLFPGSSSSSTFSSSSTSTSSGGPASSSGTSSSTSSNGGGSSSSSSSSASSGGTTNIYAGGLAQGWSDWSYSAKQWYGSGPDGGKAYCTTISAGGAASFGGQQGAFAGKSQLQFYIKRNDAGTPDFSVQLSGSGGTCRDVRLQSLSPGSKGSDWLSVSIPLNAFSWSSPDWSSSTFKGCGSGSLGDRDVTALQLKNNRGSDQTLCLDQVKLS